LIYLCIFTCLQFFCWFLCKISMITNPALFLADLYIIFPCKRKTLLTIILFHQKRYYFIEKMIRSWIPFPLSYDWLSIFWYSFLMIILRVFFLSSMFLYLYIWKAEFTSLANWMRINHFSWFKEPRGLVSLYLCMLILRRRDWIISCLCYKYNFHCYFSLYFLFWIV